MALLPGWAGRVVLAETLVAEEPSRDETHAHAPFESPADAGLSGSTKFRWGR